MTEWDAQLWPKLRGSGYLWHSTSLTGCGGIAGTGEITPNTGQFPVSFPQSLSSLSRYLSAVSLFYFDAATDDEIRVHGWDYSFLSSSAVRVMIKIDGCKLDRSLLLLPGDLRAQKASVLGGKLLGRRECVPYIEAIYRAAVPASSFLGYCVAAFADGHKLQWQEVQPTPSALNEINAIANDWTARWPKFRPKPRVVPG